MKTGFSGGRFGAKLCSGPAFRFQQEDCNDRKHVIGFKSFIKEAADLGGNLYERQSIRWESAAKLVFDAVAEGFSSDEEVQKTGT